jgi:predicted anti-sigma-YlaC factor YlaD
MRGRSRNCDRVRASISAELDGELCEFDSILLRGHLLYCGPCRTFRRDSVAFTHALRAAPLEPMSRQPVLVSRRRRIGRWPVQVPGVAALAVLMVASGGLFASLQSGSVLRQPRGVGVGVLDDQDAHAIQRLKPVAALAELKVRREALRATQSRRSTGFQNP